MCTPEQHALRYTISCFAHQVHDEVWRPLQPASASRDREGCISGEADTLNVTSMGLGANPDWPDLFYPWVHPFRRPEERLIGARVVQWPEVGVRHALVTGITQVLWQMA